MVIRYKMVKHFWKCIALTIAERDFNGLNKQNFLNHKSILIEWCYFCETEKKKRLDAMRKAMVTSSLFSFGTFLEHNGLFLAGSFFLIAVLHHTQGTLELSLIAKEIWLSIHLRKFGSHMALCPSTLTLFGAGISRLCKGDEESKTCSLRLCYQGGGSSPRGSQWSLSSVGLKFRLRQKTLKDIIFRMCLYLGHVFGLVFCHAPGASCLKGG